MTPPRTLELIFPGNAHTGDLTILTPATHAAPGAARLGAARIVPVEGAHDAGRLMSGNGGGFIGLVGYGEPERPFSASYWLVEEE